MKNNEKIMKYQIPKNLKLLEKVKQLSVEQLEMRMKGYMIHIVHLYIPLLLKMLKS